MSDPIKQKTIFTERSRSYRMTPKLTSSFMQTLIHQKESNKLDKPLLGNNVNTYKGKKYAIPQFRLLPKGPSEIPGQQGLRFSKDEGSIHMNIIVESFRDEQDVVPLKYSEIKIGRAHV